MELESLHRLALRTHCYLHTVCCWPRRILLLHEHRFRRCSSLCGCASFFGFVRLSCSRIGSFDPSPALDAVYAENATAAQAIHRSYVSHVLALLSRSVLCLFLGRPPQRLALWSIVVACPIWKSEGGSAPPGPIELFGLGLKWSPTSLSTSFWLSQAAACVFGTCAPRAQTTSPKEASVAAVSQHFVRPPTVWLPMEPAAEPTTVSQHPADQWVTPPTCLRSASRWLASLHATVLPRCELSVPWHPRWCPLANDTLLAPELYLPEHKSLRHFLVSRGGNTAFAVAAYASTSHLIMAYLSLMSTATAGQRL